MSAPKITIIGAGGFVFPFRLIGDLLSFPALRSAELCLMDVNPTKLGPVAESKTSEVKAWELAGFVGAEVKSHGGRIDKEAAQALAAQVVRPALEHGEGEGPVEVLLDEGQVLVGQLVLEGFGGRGDDRLAAAQHQGH